MPTCIDEIRRYKKLAWMKNKILIVKQTNGKSGVLSLAYDIIYRMIVELTSSVIQVCHWLKVRFVFKESVSVLEVKCFGTVVS